MKNKKYIIILGIIILAVVGYNFTSSGNKITTEDIFDPVKMEAAKEEASPEVCNSMFLSVYEVFKSKFLAVMLVEDVKQCYAKLGYESGDKDICKDIEKDIFKGVQEITDKEYNGNSEAYYWCMGGVAARNRDGDYIQGTISRSGGNTGKYVAEGMSYAVDNVEECNELLKGGGDMPYESKYSPRVPSEFSCYFAESIRADDDSFCDKIKNSIIRDRCIYYRIIKNRQSKRCYFDECKAQYALATGDISACDGDSDCESVAKRYVGDIDINSNSKISGSKENFKDSNFLSKFFSSSRIGCEGDDDCERGNYCYEGECIDNCAHAKCNENQYCELGICECNEGYKRCNKECIDLDNCCMDSDCDSGLVCEKGECVDKCAMITCGENQECQDGNCQCAKGYKECEDSSCIFKDGCCNDDDCDNGMFCRSGECGYGSWYGVETKTGEIFYGQLKYFNVYPLKLRNTFYSLNKDLDSQDIQLASRSKAGHNPSGTIYIYNKENYYQLSDNNSKIKINIIDYFDDLSLDEKTSADVGGDNWYMLKTLGNKMYFGQIFDLSAKNVEMTNMFYIIPNNEEKDDDPSLLKNISITKYRPNAKNDSMNLRADLISYIEPLSADSKMLEPLNKYLFQK